MFESRLIRFFNDISFTELSQQQGLYLLNQCSIASVFTVCAEKFYGETVEASGF